MPDPTPRAPASWPGPMRLTPAARDLFCRDLGVTPEEADALTAATEAEMAAPCRAYRAGHPDATVRDFALAQLEATAFAMAVDMGLPRGHARRLARETRVRAEARP